MSNLKLSIATTDYDHFRDFRLGFVKAEGIDHTWLNLGHHECFARFTANREFDLSELSFAKFSTQITRDDSDIVGLPVICSRLFRFSSFYVNKKSRIKTVAGPEGQEDRFARMGAFGRRLHARLDAQRDGREADRRALVSGGRERAGPRGEGRAQSAQGAEAHARLRQDR